MNANQVVLELTTAHIVQIFTSLLAIASVVSAKDGVWKLAAPLLIVSHAILAMYFILTQQYFFLIFNVGMIAAATRNWMAWRKRQRLASEVVAGVLKEA